MRHRKSLFQQSSFLVDFASVTFIQGEGNPQDIPTPSPKMACNFEHKLSRSERLFEIGASADAPKKKRTTQKGLDIAVPANCLREAANRFFPLALLGFCSAFKRYGEVITECSTLIDEFFDTISLKQHEVFFKWCVIAKQNPNPNPFLHMKMTAKPLLLWKSASC